MAFDTAVLNASKLSKYPDTVPVANPFHAGDLPRTFKILISTTSPGLTKSLITFSCSKSTRIFYE